MLEDASNQELLAAWKNEGKQNAAQILVQRYMVRLTALARSRLSRKLARRIDAEDVVMSAWRSFFVGANIGKLSLSHDNDLWPLLVAITLRKLYRQAARHTADRRDAGLDISFEENIDWQAVVSRDPSPEEAAMLIDEVESIMQQLGAVDREVLSRRLQGEEQPTIASAMNCSERTVRRSLQRMRTMIARRDQNITPGDHQRKPALQQVVRDEAATEIAATTPYFNLKPTFKFGDVSLKKQVGFGGFGKVYQAVLNSDGSTVAVKFLRKRFWKDQQARDLLLRETSLVSSLSHPSIIRHLGWGELPSGAAFVVMDWVEGHGVGDWFELSPEAFSEIIRCGIVIADALNTAHAAGLVHGDITPNNVLRRTDGEFFLTDFGFAKFVGDHSLNVWGGTPGFLAPEQVSDLFGQVGVHSDVYGLGGLIYSLLTGTAPMKGRDISDILANVLSSQLPHRVTEFSEKIPQALDDLLFRCLQKEPRKRPGSIKDVATVLKDIERRI